MIRRQRTIRAVSPALLAAAFSTAAWTGAGAQQKAVSAATSTAVASTLVSDVGTSAQVVGEPLHLLVGRSMFVNTDNRIRRVYVSNPDVLDSFTSSPHQIVITAKTPGLSTLVLWDENGQSHAWQINSDVDVANLHQALQDAFPGENIRVEGHADQVALAGTVSSPETADAAFKLAGVFSKDVANSLVVSTRHTPQVRLKVRVIEIDRSRAEQLGFNFFGPGMNTFSSSTGQFGTVTVGATTPSRYPLPPAPRLCCRSAICWDCSITTRACNWALPWKHCSRNRLPRFWLSPPSPRSAARKLRSFPAVNSPTPWCRAARAASPRSRFSSGPTA
jgi:pilus assembly protein CpaC